MYRDRHPRLARINPESRDGDLDDPPHYQVSRPMSQSYLQDQGPSLTITQSRSYLPFPDRRRVSQTPSSPSIYPPTLAVVNDDVSTCQLPNPTSIPCQKNTTVLDQGYNCGASAKRHTLHRAPVEPGIYMTPPDSGYDKSSPNVVQQEPVCDRGRRHVLPPIPPPIPPKSPLRTTMLTQTMHPNVSLCALFGVSSTQLDQFLDCAGDRSVRAIDIG